MPLFNVNIERVVNFEFVDTVDVPAEVVRKGPGAIREYINDVVDEYDMERETYRNSIVFEEIEE